MTAYHRITSGAGMWAIVSWGIFSKRVCVCVCACHRESLALVETTRMNEVNQGNHLKSVHQRADDRTLRNTKVSVVNRGETRLKKREKEVLKYIFKKQHINVLSET